jgi:YD repeat-containing protein
LASRLWARGTNTTYLYNLAGELSTTYYSDTATSGITNAFDRRGRVIGVTNGVSICALNIGDPGQLLNEKWLAGPLSGLTVSNVYDSVLRRTTNGLWNGTSWLAQTKYAYDPGSRLSTVSDGANTAGYSYVGNSPLLGEIDFTNSTTRRMVTTKGYDFLNRLTNISSTAGGATVASFNYRYNDANQRASVTNADGSYIVYSYDSLGQVTAGNKYWSDGTPVAGQQFNYAFDDIGNRTSTAIGGDETGSNLRSASYAANSLNQYTSRTVPGYMNVLGSANSNATVSLWTDNGAYAPTTRKGTYFRGELAVDNSANALWLTVTNVAVLTNGASPDIVTNFIGNAFVPQTAEIFLYDLDGNLTVNGRWTNSWNGEKRLIGMVCQTNAASGSKRRLTFGYDYQGLANVETGRDFDWFRLVSDALQQVRLRTLEHDRGIERNEQFGYQELHVGN